jgi:hypothetical protein
MSSNIQKILRQEAMAYANQQRKLRQTAWKNRYGSKKRQTKSNQNKKDGDWLTVSRRGQDSKYITSVPKKKPATTYNTFMVLRVNDDQEKETCEPVVESSPTTKPIEKKSWANIVKDNSIPGNSPKVWEKPSSIIPNKPTPTKLSDYVVKKESDSKRVRRDAWSDDEEDAPKKSWNEIMEESDDED